MKKNIFKKVNDSDRGNKISCGTGAMSFYIRGKIEKIIESFGNPTVIGSSDNKVQATWVFTGKSGEVFTIYDYKENRSLNEIELWHVGGKKVEAKKVAEFLKDKYFDLDGWNDAIDEPIKNKLTEKQKGYIREMVKNNFFKIRETAERALEAIKEDSSNEYPDLIIEMFGSLAVEGILNRNPNIEQEALELIERQADIVFYQKLSMLSMAMKEGAEANINKQKIKNIE